MKNIIKICLLSFVISFHQLANAELFDYKSYGLTQPSNENDQDIKRIYEAFQLIFDNSSTFRNLIASTCQKDSISLKYIEADDGESYWNPQDYSVVIVNPWNLEFYDIASLIIFEIANASQTPCVYKVNDNAQSNDYAKKFLDIDSAAQNYAQEMEFIEWNSTKLHNKIVAELIKEDVENAQSMQRYEASTNFEDYISTAKNSGHWDYYIIYYKSYIHPQ